MLKTVSTQLALASDTLPEVLAKGNTTGGTDLAVSAGDDITFADNSKAIFGAGSDLSIYSDGATGQVTGSVNVTGAATFGGTVSVVAASTNPTIVMARSTTGNNNMTKYSTGGTDEWIVGQRNDGTSNFRFYSYATASDVVSIGTSGNLSLASGNVVLANGAGIDFSATPGTGTSELLDDYEEGTWTPTYLGLTTSGTTTYGVSNGLYVKAGQMVTVTGVMTWSAATGTGGAALGGLPFTINNSAGEADGSVWIGTESGYTLTGQLGAFLVRGTSTAYLQVYNNGSATAANIINGSVALRFAFSYRSN